jgi:hypothetical protein
MNRLLYRWRQRNMVLITEVRREYVSRFVFMEVGHRRWVKRS